MSAPRNVNYAGGVAARYTLLAAAVGLTMFGLVMVYSASSIAASVKEGASWAPLMRQAAAVVFSVAVAWFIARYDYRALRERATLLWAGSVGLLVITLLLGVARGGARRWIPLGFINLQPSELAKIACVLLVASLAVEWQRKRISGDLFFRRTAIAVGIPALLVLIQPDLGTTLTLAAAVAFVLLLAGVPWRYFAGMVGGVVVLGVVAILAEPFRMKRIFAFANPWADPQGSGYQSIQALLAFGTGGIDGVGLGLSRQKFFYLPEAHTDFILAIIGEEIGLLGTLGVVAGFALIAWAGFRIASGARDPFGKLVAGALTGMLVFQAFLNMAAVTGIMPVTGKPLPFLSYGGASMLVTLMSVALILSVSEYGSLAPRAVRQRPVRKESRRESAHERRGDSRPHLSRVDGGRASRRRA